MKGKEALSAARRRIADLEADIAARDAQHRRQVETLRQTAREKDAAAQRHLTEVTTALRSDVEEGSSARVRQLELEVAQLRESLDETATQSDQHHEIKMKILTVFCDYIRTEGMTPHEAYERVLDLTGLIGQANITVKSRSTHSVNGKDPVAARRIERARGIRSTEWAEMPKGLDAEHKDDCRCPASLRGNHG